MRLPLFIVLLLGCSGPAGRSGFSTTIDSTGDTVRVSIRGGETSGGELRLVEEVRIAPGAEDTSLFTQVSDFKVDPQGRAWVYDNPTNRILLFDRAGKLVRRIGRQGGGPGELNSNSGMVVLGDSGVAVWDPRNGRVSIFDSAGSFRTSWPTPSTFSSSDGLVTDRGGTLYIKQIVTPRQEGDIFGRIGLVRLRGQEGFGDSLVPPALGVAVVNYIAERVTKQGSSRSSWGAEFGPREFWTWHPDGYFVAADGGRYRIVLARVGAKPLVIHRELPPVPVSEDERNEERDRIAYGLQRVDPRWSWSGPPLPLTKAPLMSLFIARDRRVWARIAAPSERIPEAELDPPRDPKQPFRHFRTPLAYEVFSPEGRFLGRVRFPSQAGRLMEADGNSVWALLRDENELPAVVRFRVEPGFGEGTPN